MYEYTTKRAANHKWIKRVANRMARDGWELTEQTLSGWGRGTIVLTFRRETTPKPTFREALRKLRNKGES